MNVCEFCKKEYKTKSSLNHHKKTVKKCILIQGKRDIELFKCNYCDFNTPLKSSLVAHNCKFKHISTKINSELDQEKEKSIAFKTELIQEKEKVLLLQTELKIQKEYASKLEEKIKTHEVHLFALSSKATTTTTSNVRINNVYNNLETLDLNEEKIRRAVEDNFTDNHFNDGVKGVARFTKDYILKSTEGKTKYICSDTSRGIFKYLDENGLLQKDVKASKLKNSIQAPISKKSHTIFMVKLDEEEHNDKAAEIVCLNFSKIRNIDVNDYAKELALVV